MMIMVESDQIVERLVDVGKSLTPAEREKALGPYDPIYLKERIRFHSRRVQLRRLSILLLYLGLLLGIFALFWRDLLVTSMAWILGCLIVVLVLVLVIGLPTLWVNHGRNAALLKLVCAVREMEDARGVMEASGSTK